MQPVREYVEHLKRKPAHQRERIALFSSVAITALVAMGYMANLTASDRLTIGAPREQFLAERPQENFSSLVGAAAAFNTSVEKGDLTVVESKTTSTMDTSDQSSATVIPF